MRPLCYLHCELLGKQRQILFILFIFVVSYSNCCGCCSRVVDLFIDAVVGVVFGIKCIPRNAESMEDV